MCLGIILCPAKKFERVSRKGGLYGPFFWVTGSISVKTHVLLTVSDLYLHDSRG